ncbi:DUF2846 domain-containing protein [Massilia sp. BJB1822]|uniref:DUF2846 domain-containing protein n=1 Tax=Massilia sp. BJB1822 TaxID=2744470 RepID=UPI0015940FEF|nr:DUF2846 domain-containing protein [Massilia sp. BJB1822]NVD99032.1 DUF2846 domain-containing protein [Massilia sp. BJB1822]
MSIAKIAAIALAVGLTGCAATGPKFQDAEAAAPKLSADQGRIYFYRGTSYFGAALQPSIVLDGTAVGNSQRGSYFYVDAKPGSHEAQTSTEATNKLSFVLESGEIKYVRTSVGLGLMVGRVVPELVGAEEARKEIADLNYSGTTTAK